MTALRVSIKRVGSVYLGSVIGQPQAESSSPNPLEAAEQAAAKVFGHSRLRMRGCDIEHDTHETRGTIHIEEL